MLLDEASAWQLALIALQQLKLRHKKFKQFKEYLLSTVVTYKNEKITLK